MATKEPAIRFVRDAAGNDVEVIIPIDLWREIQSERETAYLLKSPAMKNRLLQALGRTSGISLEEARAKFGI